MTQALFTSMTGLNAGTEQLTVVSDNVANMNTTAYKTSRVDFQDIWYRTKTTGTNSTQIMGGTNPYQIGVGVRCASISKDFSSGTTNSTGRSEDLAITGNGWFTVVNSDGKMLLTRDGTLALDENGYLCTANGNKLLGTDKAVSMTNCTTPIKIPTSIKVQEYATPVSPTSTVNTLSFNEMELGKLNALGTSKQGITAGTFYVHYGSDVHIQVTLPDGNNPTITDGISESTTVNKDNDSKSLISIINKSANLKFVDKDGNILSPQQVVVNIGGTDQTITDPSQLFKADTSDGVITFSDKTTNKTNITLSSGTSNFVAATGLASAGCVEGVTTSNVLNYSAIISQMDDVTLDTTRQYSSFSIGQDGIVTATYSDGSVLTIKSNDNDGICFFSYTDANGIEIVDNNANNGNVPLYVDPNVLVLANMQVQVAKVANDYGLVAQGNNQYTVGVDCGDVIYTNANRNGAGAIVSGALEASNVDLAQQFANMILAQRLVQANSQVFSGANSMLETLVYLGRG